MKNIKISIQNLSKSFGKKKILNQVNLDIYSNEILTIIGGSGSGKSVFMKIILGLINKDSGKILFDGIEITEQTRKNFYENIDVLFQSNALFDSMNIEENILFPFINRDDIDDLEKQKLLNEVLESVNLKSDIKKYSISEISGGMQKRVALARAIITRPSVIFLDEPTSGLDMKTAQSIFLLIQSLSKKYSMTFFLITHDIYLAPKISNRIFFLKNGSLDFTENDEIEKKVMGD
jgi:phospholipid/cholesterol/gamma-HCH transport system ATP-binding protein